MTKIRQEQATDEDNERPPVFSKPVLPGLDVEMRTLTPREQHIAELTEKNKAVGTKFYDITSQNSGAMRVVYDWNGIPISIPPGETRRRVLLHPSTAAQLGRGDLVFTVSA